MKVSKKKIIEKILNYVFKTYCDDEEIALLAQDYYEAEKRLNEIKPREKKVYYKITQEVRDFLEPLVDAEYFKLKNYVHNLEPVVYDTMSMLNTKMWNKVNKNERRNNNTK